MNRLSTWWHRQSRRGKIITVGVVTIVALGVVGSAPPPPVPVGTAAVLPTPSLSATASVSPVVLPSASSVEPTAASAVPSPAPTPSPGPTAKPSPESALRSIVEATFSGDANSSKHRLRDVQIVPQEGGGWGVFVQFNADDNLSSRLTKDGIEIQMRAGYKALYTSGLNVRAATMAAWLDVVDKLGNGSEAMVYKTILDGKTGNKVNWANADILEWADIWETSILYPFLTQ